MSNLFKRRVTDPLRALLMQGASPDRLALCVAIGIVVGLIPVLGVSTLLCAAIALPLRLNLAAIQIAQAAMAPLQLLLVLPFVRLGEWMTGAAAQPVSVSTGIALMRQGLWHAVVTLRDSIFHAGIAWIAVAPLSGYALYRILKPIFTRASAAFPDVQDGPGR